MSLLHLHHILINVSLQFHRLIRNPCVLWCKEDSPDYKVLLIGSRVYYISGGSEHNSLKMGVAQHEIVHP